MVNAVGGSSILSQIGMAEMRQRMFNNADANSDGKISKDEMAKVVANMPQGGPSVDDIFSKLDTNGDGSISKSEFEAWMASGSNSTQSTTTTNDLAETLLEALGKQSQSAASAGASGSQGSTSATSIAALLSNALKSYAQSSSNSWSQTGLEGLLSAGLQV